MCRAFGAGKYFRLSRHLYTLFLLVSLSAPEAFRILVGASPLFLAYGLLGTTAFGSSSTRFSSFTSSLTTLFSLMNGDIVLETLSVLKLNFPVLGPMYLASFFFLFTYFFLNVVLTVVEEALWMLNKEAGAHMVADRGRLTGASSRLGSRRISRILLRARSRMSTERLSTDSVSRRSMRGRSSEGLGEGGDEQWKEEIDEVRAGIEGGEWYGALVGLVEAHSSWCALQRGESGEGREVEREASKEKDGKWLLSGRSVVLWAVAAAILAYLTCLGMGYFAVVSDKTELPGRM